MFGAEAPASTVYAEEARAEGGMTNATRRMSIAAGTLLSDSRTRDLAAAAIFKPSRAA